MSEITDMSENAKHIVDALSIGTVAGTLAGILPSIAAIFTIVWTAVRIYETKTVQKLLGRTKPPKAEQE
jgi:chromate transport protein ChrA